MDHAWTYRLNEARQNLRDHEPLLNRMCNLMAVERTEEDSKEDFIESIMSEMWKFNQTYKLSTEQLTDEEREPIWYIMDEFGSSVRHSNSPNVSCVPFFYLPTKTMFSVIFPTRDLHNGG